MHTKTRVQISPIKPSEHPAYRVWNAETHEKLGEVHRTGTLPSCQRWWPVAPFVSLTSVRTLKEAIDVLANL